MVDAALEGVERAIFEKIGLHAQDTAELFFDQVKVPKNQRLGKEIKVLPTSCRGARERLSISMMALGSILGAIELTSRDCCPAT